MKAGPVLQKSYGYLRALETIRTILSNRTHSRYLELRSIFWMAPNVQNVIAYNSLYIQEPKHTRLLMSKKILHPLSKLWWISCSKVDVEGKDFLSKTISEVNLFKNLTLTLPPCNHLRKRWLLIEEHTRLRRRIYSTH